MGNRDYIHIEPEQTAETTALLRLRSGRREGTRMADIALPLMARGTYRRTVKQDERKELGPNCCEQREKSVGFLDHNASFISSTTAGTFEIILD